MRVFCSSEGDQLLYSWTLNGDPLKDGNSSIDLDEGTDGDISCSVKNHVSHAQKTIRLKPCPGLDQFCRFDQSDPCYTALGHKLNLMMVQDASKYDLKITKIINYTQDDPVCRVKYDRMRMSECDLYNNRPEVTVINGSLIINRVNRTDSGNYRLRLVDSDGSETSRDLQVIVEAPIGSVEVSIICSSNQTSVFCSSEGDQLLYSWTLNGEILEGPMFRNSSIDLDEGTEGDISCSVKNHVSHAQKTIRLKPCPGLDQFCRFDQSDPCYTALGYKLNLSLVQDAIKYDLTIKKRINYNTADGSVCRVKNGRMRTSQCDLYNNRTEVTVINGTVIINRVNRTDSGNYRLTFSHSEGEETSRDLQVIVEAPIGSVEVSVICSSSGVMRVFCSSDGDQLLYSWTLNGDPLMDGNSSIDLDEGTDGDISCSVKNHVSHAQKTIRLKPCPGSTTAAVTSVTSNVTSNVTSAVTRSSQTLENVLLIVIASGCAALILILLFTIVCCVYKKKQLKSTPAPAGDTELIYNNIPKKKNEKTTTESLPAADEEYAAVRPQTKRKKKKKGEEEENGEVTFAPNHSVAPMQPQEERSIYAQVQRR
ncbi:uncharacterized protein LOC113114378 [Carassius auratus]|uniref:Uncharacterized protein LOC113114378 n=1 Tax=Carassius auratus TaxID=7957 RepID=A0A6P6QUK5_CARAU|nr:uncharacterized protein LOC113114378 [Carassius auratus]